MDFSFNFKKTVPLNIEYLQELEAYIQSGDMTKDFLTQGQEKRYEMLEFLEKLMDLGEAADTAASEMIFKNSQLGTLMAAGPKGE